MELGGGDGLALKPASSFLPNGKIPSTHSAAGFTGRTSQQRHRGIAPRIGSGMQIALCSRKMFLMMTAALLLLPALQIAQLGPIDQLDLPPTDLERVAVGDEAPDFRLPDQSGAAHQLSLYRGDKKVVLVFYRGHW